MTPTPEQGRDMQRRAEEFYKALQELQERLGIVIEGYDSEFNLQDKATGEQIATVSTYEPVGIEYDEETVDPEGYARRKEREHVPMPAIAPKEYLAWKEHHPDEAALFEQAIREGHTITKPTEQFEFTMGPAAERWEEAQKLYSGGTRGLTTEDFGYHNVDWDRLQARVGATTPFKFEDVERASKRLLETDFAGGTPDPRGYRP